MEKSRKIMKQEKEKGQTEENMFEVWHIKNPMIYNDESQLKRIQEVEN